MTVDLSTFLILALIFLGIAFKHRKKSIDIDQFHIANWSASKFAVVASVVALFGAGEIATFTDLYSNIGSGIIVFFLGAATGFLCLAFLADRVHIETRALRRKSAAFQKAYQINDVVYDRYGTASLIIFTILASTSLVALYLIQVIVGSDLIAMGSGVSYEWAVLGVSFFVALYVIISGLDGIYSTDKIQVLALFTALLLIAYISVNDFNVDVVAEYTQAFASVDITIFLTLFFPGFFAVVGPDVLQRIISVKTSEDLKRISFASAAGWIVLGLILVIFSAGIAGYSSGATSGFIQFLSDAEGAPRVVIIVALVCALLSTADTETHAVALLINRAVSPKSPPSVNLSRILIALVCASGCILAFFFKDLAALYGMILNIFMILGPVVFAILFKRGNSLSKHHFDYLGITTFILYYLRHLV